MSSEIYNFPRTNALRISLLVYARESRTIGTYGAVWASVVLREVQNKTSSTPEQIAVIAAVSTTCRISIFKIEVVFSKPVRILALKNYPQHYVSG